MCVWSGPVQSKSWRRGGKRKGKETARPPVRASTRPPQGAQGLSNIFSQVSKRFVDKGSEGGKAKCGCTLDQFKILPCINFLKILVMQGLCKANLALSSSSDEQ